MCRSENCIWLRFLAAIAIVLGFKREIRDKVIGFNSHITLYAVPAGPEDSNLITLTPTLRALLDSQDFITSYSLEASIPAILKTADDFKGIYLKSMSGEALRKFLSSNIEMCELNPITLSRISRLNPNTMAMAASITATESATAATATRIAGELCLPPDARESLLARYKG